MFPNLEGSDADDIYALNYGDVVGGVCHFFAVDSLELCSDDWNLFRFLSRVRHSCTTRK